MFALSLVAGALFGGALGTFATPSLSPASVTGAMMLQQRPTRLLCDRTHGCLPCVQAMELAELGLCQDMGLLWSVAITSSLMCGCLFALGISWRDRYVLRSLLGKAKEGALPPSDAAPGEP